MILLILPVLFLTGCAGGGRGSASVQDERALELYRRSLKELEGGEYSPALSDAVRAEQLCRSKDLKARLANHRADILNHVQVYSTLEDRATLKYTLLYNMKGVFYPIENVHVQFTFIQGEGILSPSANTNGNGTASITVERITSLHKKIVIEAVPLVHLGDELLRVDELKRDFLLSRRQAVQEPEQGTIFDFIESILEDIFTWEVTP